MGLNISFQQIEPFLENIIRLRDIHSRLDPLISFSVWYCLKFVKYPSIFWQFLVRKGENSKARVEISRPILSKSLDFHVGGLCQSGWVTAKAITQCQGPGLLLTQTILYFPSYLCTLFLQMLFVSLIQFYVNYVYNLNIA